MKLLRDHRDDLIVSYPSLIYMILNVIQKGEFTWNCHKPVNLMVSLYITWQHKLIVYHNTYIEL